MRFLRLNNERKTLVSERIRTATFGESSNPSSADASIDLFPILLRQQKVDYNISRLGIVIYQSYVIALTVNGK